MKQFIAFIRKEFLHIWRDKRTLVILFGMPLVQIIIFGFALTNEVKNSKIAVLDLAKDESSRRLLSRLDASRYFDVSDHLYSFDQIESLFRKGAVRMAVVIPSQYETSLIQENKATVQLLADATDPNVATTLIQYATAILLDEQKSYSLNTAAPLQIQPEIRMLYNPQLVGAYNFVPGVMAMVLMIVSTLMTSLAIVQEKERGNMEIILVSPLRPFGVIIAKAIPYLGLSIINIISILLLSVFVLEVPIRGNIFLLLGESILFAITSLSLGLLISSATSSQQVAMFISLVGLFLPTVMLSGFMFPVENMPLPLRMISNVVPAKWYYSIVKNVMIKGTGLDVIWKETLILAGMTIFFLTMSIKKFKHRLA